jgi:hypothetical protein
LSGDEFELKPDYEMVKRRFEAFWEGEILDRALVSMQVAKKRPVMSLPKKAFASHRDRWLDLEYRIDEIDAQLSNAEFIGEALPIAFTNMGPEIFSAWCGCGYEFGETTTWSVPAIEDWERDAPKARLDMDHPLFKKLEELTRGLIERGRGRFITSLTDFHPGGDHLAALRDPERLAMDLIDHPGEVKALLKRAETEYFAAYDHFYDMIRAAGLPATSWIPAIAEGRFYIPSNDFSCMISPAMFEEFFLEGIVHECAFYDRSIYHLDGPGALRHLDALLAIPDLDGIQWVPGAGNENFERWIPVYRRIQAAGKRIYLICDVSDLGAVFEALRPEGVWIASLGGVEDRETAEAVLERVARWK